MSDFRRRGRIRADQRDTNDDVAIIGSDIAAPTDLAEKYNETAKCDMTNTCRRNYRNRNAKIIEFWKEFDPAYYAVGVRDVPEEEYNDPTKWFFSDSGKFKKDIVYEGLNEAFVLHFWVSTKINEKNGKHKSVGDLRKYRDAIVWGAKTAKQQLPRTFYVMADSFLNGYKKEWTNQKKLGNVEDTSADPISRDLYKLILRWALDQNNIMVWHWTQAQWNCMARSASIDPLHTDNFKIGGDSLVVKYDDSKADKNAERLSEKNIYANPHNWRMCYWTGLGIYVALRGEAMTDNRNLFLNKSAKPGTASTRYCEQLEGIVRLHQEEIQNHMEFDRFNPYGIRKGAATHAVSGTTMPPSIPSIARRGEWSIGAVLDVYWHFNSVGDQYLG